MGYAQHPREPVSIAQVDRDGFLAAGLSAIMPVRGASPPTKPPGRLISVGGRRLHLVCKGKGSPTVILESGAGEFT
jgi:hypothetical protein